MSISSVSSQSTSSISSAIPISESHVLTLSHLNHKVTLIASSTRLDDFTALCKKNTDWNQAITESRQQLDQEIAQSSQELEKNAKIFVLRKSRLEKKINNNSTGTFLRTIESKKNEKIDLSKRFDSLVKIHDRLIKRLQITFPRDLQEKRDYRQYPADQFHKQRIQQIKFNYKKQLLDLQKRVQRLQQTVQDLQKPPIRFFS